MKYNFTQLNIFSNKLIFSAIFLTFLFSLSNPTLAASLPTGQVGDLRLTTSPLPINLQTTPSSAISTTLKVKNDGTQTENIKVSLMKFKADASTGQPILSDREKGDNYFDWVTFSDQTFALPVNEWKTLTATFTVPKEASFDYYYAIVFSRADEPTPAGDHQTVLVGGTATLVLLEVQVPDAKREIQVTDFSVNKNIFEFLPANFTIKLRNTGNVHVAPRGNIFINQGNQKDLAILEVNPNQGSILPNSPPDFQQSWSDGFPYYTNQTQDGKVVTDNQGNIQQELKWNFADASKLRWGKYTAKLLLIYDDGHRDVPIEAEVSFWVVPWRIIIVLIINIIIIIGFFYLLWYVFRNKRKKIIDK
jgi:hypothetical protein